MGLDAEDCIILSSAYRTAAATPSHSPPCHRFPRHGNWTSLRPLPYPPISLLFLSISSLVLFLDHSQIPAPHPPNPNRIPHIEIQDRV